MLAALQRIREENPEEPFWKGVRRLEVKNGALMLEFHEPHDPALFSSADVEVACHLYNAPV